MERAENLPKTAWTTLVRPALDVNTSPRTRPDNGKQPLVREHGFDDIHLVRESVAEFQYRPAACRETYRIVVVRKNLTIEQGPAEQRRLFDDVRYFFYITNLVTPPAAEIVRTANQRCNQENLLAQLQSGVHATDMPVGCLVSHGAYLVMAARAWSMKAWCALLGPVQERWRAKQTREKSTLLRVEFRTFLHAVLLIPCQIVRTGRRIVDRLLSWNPWHEVLFRFLDRLAPLHG